MQNLDLRQCLYYNLTMCKMQGTFEVNTLAPIRLTSLLLPGMLQRGKGQFVMVSSAAGKVPSPCQSVYAASKHAVNGYFHTLRSEVNQQGIKVCVVCPGPIETSTSKAPRSKEVGAV
jgi:dehydrogenase/reductase SDR family protein 7